ncbi:MAG: peptidase S41 [Mediterranea sp.]|nr:peptidase S41 [Mediterranea sp.]
MKTRHIPLLLLIAMMLPAYLSSCGEDRWAEYAEQTQTDRWIDDTMRVWYYWNKEIPESNKLNYFTKPADFFKSLLSPDDKFSVIDSLKPSTRSIPDTDNSYGFQFSIDQRLNDTAYFVRVLYVAENSPAYNAGLQRGDFIIRVNDRYITNKNYTQLLFNGGAVALTAGRYDAESDGVVAYDQPLQMEASRAIEDNPVLYRNVYTRGDKQIGYLVYNHFSFGPTDDYTNRPYDQSLLEASNYFASRQINELILDLRYNNGGYLSCAELLCALIAPTSALGSELGYALFNEQHGKAAYTLNPQLITGGSNLNLNRLYVLTSTQTASASEMVINSLKPYMEVVVVGQKTVGKNVGSTAFSNEELQITMNPIVCKIYNAENSSDYAQGFQPDYPMSETSEPARFLPFGNENEMLLGNTLDIIAGGGDTPAETRAAATIQPTTVFNSVSRRASNAVQIN